MVLACGSVAKPIIRSSAPKTPCNSNRRRHVTVAVRTTQNNTICTNTLHACMMEIRKVFAASKWTISWLVASAVSTPEGPAIHMAIKSENAHKSTVKTKISRAILNRLRTTAHVHCRNGAGPLALHVLGMDTHNCGRVGKILADGIEISELKAIAVKILRHCPKRGTRKRSVPNASPKESLEENSGRKRRKSHVACTVNQSLVSVTSTLEEGSFVQKATPTHKDVTLNPDANTCDPSQNKGEKVCLPNTDDTMLDSIVNLVQKHTCLESIPFNGSSGYSEKSEDEDEDEDEE